MAISFRLHGTRNTQALTSGLGEVIDDRAKLDECVGINPWLAERPDAAASRLIEHPARNHDPQLGFIVHRLLFDLYQHARLTALPSASQDSHFLIEERMKTINDPRRPELAGSVWIRCGGSA
jgi:hypothetical protein